MDYAQFKTYEKIVNAEAFPRTRQEKGLFLLELDFSPVEPTRAVPVPFRVGFSAFGHVVGLTVESCLRYAPAAALDALGRRLASSQKGFWSVFRQEAARLEIRLLDNPVVRERAVPGSFIYNSGGELVTLVARLREDV